MDLMAKKDVPQHVDDLEGASAIDDELSVADEGEGVVCASVAGGEHQLEAAGVVVGPGLEGVARGGEQIHVVAGEVGIVLGA